MSDKNRKNKTIMKNVNQVALKLVEKSANSTCMWAFHQPEFPQEAIKFKKERA